LVVTSNEVTQRKHLEHEWWRFEGERLRLAATCTMDWGGADRIALMLRGPWAGQERMPEAVEAVAEIASSVERSFESTRCGPGAFCRCAPAGATWWWRAGAPARCRELYWLEVSVRAELAALIAWMTWTQLHLYCTHKRR